jgi:hypothetical protein
MIRPVCPHDRPDHPPADVRRPQRSPQKDRGSIETGKLGDFVVLSDHLLTVSAEQLRGIRADLTVIGGHVAFERWPR